MRGEMCLIIAMKKFFVFPAVIAVAALISCQKQQTEAEKNAEVERQVQERLAAEHQAEQQQQLQQQQADLDAREKALAEKENAAAATPARRERAEPEPVTRARAVSGAGPTSGYSTFYNKLESYGDWIETGDYGYVFHPRQAESSRSWRPYTNGRWVYTDAGWTWISEGPFGWATYHYGRWTRLRGIGWVWVPGNQWAPAWVSWRKSNDYVDWAPLPPEAQFDQHTGIHNWSDSYYDIGPDQYCFVPTREFGAQRIESTLVPPERNVTIVNQTTNVTNITYNNTTVVNQGPNYDQLRARSQQPIARLRLERRTALNIETENSRPVFKGEVVEMAAPTLVRAQSIERPPTIRETVTQTVVENGWEQIADQQAAQRARAKMKSEATPPPNAPPKTFVKPAPVTGKPRVVSPSTPVAAPAVARSTITPARAAATTSPVQTPTTAPRFTRPAQTSTPTVATTPRATPARRALSTATPAT